MITSNDFKKGTVIKLDGELFSVVEYQHVKPARGAAFVRTKVRNVRKGTIVEKTFRGGEKIEDVRLETRPMQYLYDEGDNLVFMDTESFEQESIPRTAVGDAINYIKVEDVLEITMYQGEAISVVPPNFVIVKVTYAEPGVRGDTANNVQKPVTIETGAEIRVPIFVNEGEMIKIDTRTGEYVERVK